MSKGKQNKSNAEVYLVQEVKLLEDCVSVAEKQTDDYKEAMESLRDQMIDRKNPDAYDFFVRSINAFINDQNK